MTEEIDMTTLTIKDPSKRAEYLELKYEQANRVSLYLNISRQFYGLFVVFQLLYMGISYERPTMYLFSTTSHYLLIRLVSKYPILQSFHAPLATMSYVSFIFNPGPAYF